MAKFKSFSTFYANITPGTRIGDIINESSKLLKLKLNNIQFLVFAMEPNILVFKPSGQKDIGMILQNHKTKSNMAEQLVLPFLRKQLGIDFFYDSEHEDNTYIFKMDINSIIENKLL